MPADRVFSGSPAEPVFGYCRAIRRGNLIFVSGTAAYADDGSIVAPGETYPQTLRCFEIIRKALEKLGGTMSQVVRTRMFVTDIAMASEVGRAHQAVFATHPPTATLVEVSALVDPQLVVEIEVDAVLGD
ncbi:MAG: RidA family protein [Candidatus Lambdaproteobacteria bacterium]|nr:RidA family protein [Candidatus Lambdaproteobacteria bacterium]